MKTTNKLLLGLVITLFLIVAIFIGMVKYYRVPEEGESMHRQQEEAAKEISLKKEEAIIKAVIFSPVIFLQLPRQFLQ